MERVEESFAALKEEHSNTQSLQEIKVAAIKQRNVELEDANTNLQRAFDALKTEHDLTSKALEDSQSGKDKGSEAGGLMLEQQDREWRVLQAKLNAFKEEAALAHEISRKQAKESDRRINELVDENAYLRQQLPPLDQGETAKGKMSLHEMEPEMRSQHSLAKTENSPVTTPKSTPSTPVSTTSTLDTSTNSTNTAGTPVHLKQLTASLERGTSRQQLMISSLQAMVLSSS